MTDTQSTIIAIGCAGLVAFVVLTVLLAVYVFRTNRKRCTCAAGLCERHDYKHAAYDR